MAFADAPAWWLLCPYDTEALDAAVIDEARRSHPFLWSDGRHRDSSDYGDRLAAPFDGPLPEPPGDADELVFDAGRLEDLRSFVAGHAARADLGGTRTAAIVLAVNEVATNSIRHGGGQGSLRVWEDAAGLVCEVRDQGHIHQRLAGRRQPTSDQAAGRGLWLVNQFCDLVQLRSSAAGTTVRLHMRRS